MSTPPAPSTWQTSSDDTFSPKIAPTLTALGGMLGILGGLGGWIRVTRMVAGDRSPEEVSTLAGHSRAIGWVLAVFGAVALVTSRAWLGSRHPLKVTAAVASLSLVAIGAWSLWTLDRQARSIVEGARTTPDFVTFEAGFDWGAWCLVLATILLAIGVTVGVLRELDLRRSVAE